MEKRFKVILVHNARVYRLTDFGIEAFTVTKIRIK